VTTDDDVGFDEAWVNLLDVTPFGFNLISGITYEFEILPTIDDGNPASVQAVKISLPQASYQTITPEEAKEMMEGDVVIVDVRTQEEYDAGYIEGAVFIPDFDIVELAPEQLPDLDTTILIYCRSGNRSKNAAKDLAEMGYQNVYDFGGISDWPHEIVQPS